jgi:hypothetical protein
MGEICFDLRYKVETCFAQRAEIGFEGLGDYSRPKLYWSSALGYRGSEHGSEVRIAHLPGGQFANGNLRYTKEFVPCGVEPDSVH